MHAQLLSRPPTPKFHAILECYGDPSPYLYLKSSVYLAPSGIFVSVGPQPHSVGDFFAGLRSLLEGYLRPVWLGGVKSSYKYVQHSPSMTFLTIYYVSKIIYVELQQERALK